MSFKKVGNVVFVTFIVWLPLSLYAQHEEVSSQACTYDHDVMLALDEQAFDQDPYGGWRVLAQTESCLEVAADLIRDYREENEVNTTTLYWHEGQLRASAGMAEDAIPLFEKARYDPEEDLFGWNYYVDATIAFLTADRVAIEKARENLAQLPIPENLEMVDENGNPVDATWPPNLDVVDRLIACFEKDYKEAYGNCKQ